MIGGVAYLWVKINRTSTGSVVMPLYVKAMTDDLRRQRRNLLVASVVLCFAKLAGLSVTGVSILGTSFDLANPGAIGVALWIFWVYAVIRYAQYFREDGLPKLRAARAHISLQSFQQQLTKFVNEINREIRGTFTYDALHKAGWFNRVFHGIVYNPDKGGGDDPVQVTIPRGLWMKERVHTYARLLLHTSVTDYLLPWVVGAGTLAYYVFP